MARRIKKNRTLVDLKNIINEAILEVFDSKTKTDFKEVHYGDYIAYEFQTSTGTSYDLEFHYSKELSNTVLNNDKKLKEILNTNERIVNCFDIAFTLSSVEDKSNPIEFELDTNKNEQIEVFSRIAYVIDVLIKKYKKNKLFVVGGARRNLQNVYKRIFENLFSDRFDLYFGKSIHHPSDSLFIIRKKLDKTKIKS